MTEDELKAIETRASAATVGPWRREARLGIDSEVTAWSGEVALMSAEIHAFPNGGDSRADADFIAAARSDVPALCAAVRKRDATIATLRQLIEGTVTALALSKDPQMTIVSKLLTLALSVPS